MKESNNALNINGLTPLESFIQLLPHKPYYATNKGFLRIAGKSIAMRADYIQFNPHYCVYWLVIDVDANAWELLSNHHIPSPNFACLNQGNGDILGRGHFYYLLETPVKKNNGASFKALRYLAAVERALTNRLDGDPNYVGLIGKNPLCARWFTHQFKMQPYTLGELADWFDPSELLEKPPKRENETGLGRNCDLFDTLRKWSYKAIRQLNDAGYDRWYLAVLERARALNNYTPALGDNEVKSTAKSVARWTFEHIGKGHSAAFIERQKARGALGGKAKSESYADKRSAAVQLRSTGLTYNEIAERLNVSLMTIKRWVKADGVK